MGGLVTCLFSREARDCEASTLHALADCISGPRRCPHCHEPIHEGRPKHHKSPHKGHGAPAEVPPQDEQPKAVPAGGQGAPANHLP